METTGPQEKRRALIDVRRLAIGYGNEPAIMRNLNFSVSAGEIFIIMGGSGCGKSSLLRCLIGLLRPRSGEVLLFGKKLNDAAPRERDALDKELARKKAEAETLRERLQAAAAKEQEQTKKIRDLENVIILLRRKAANY